MDPLIIHHVMRHPLSRIETNNFQDKSGCSINGIRSFLFEEGIAEDLDGLNILINNYNTMQDYRGYPIQLEIYNFDNFPLSDEILRMKNVRFIFVTLNQSKPNHKLVSPEPHFIEEEMNLIENHFFNMGEIYESEDIEEWRCFQMDSEGHLVSLFRDFFGFEFSNETIEHLSNFPYLRNLKISSSTNIQEPLTNLSLLSNLINLSLSFAQEYDDPEFLKDLGLFSNLLSLDLRSLYGFKNFKFGSFPFLYYIFCIFIRYCNSSLLFQLIQFGLSSFVKFQFSRF